MDIVSVTTTKPRFDMLRQSVSSILHQSRKPDLIVINLDKEIFHNDVWVCDEVSSRHSGVQIHVNLVQDIGPHTKLIPTLDLVFSEDRIVTIDDDIIYHSHFLERILSLSDTNPDAIACGRARRIRKNVFGGYASYMAWTPVTEGPERGRMLLPLG